MAAKSFDADGWIVTMGARLSELAKRVSLEANDFSERVCDDW